MPHELSMSYYKNSVESIDCFELQVRWSTISALVFIIYHAIIRWRSSDLLKGFSSFAFYRHLFLLIFIKINVYFQKGLRNLFILSINIYLFILNNEIYHIYVLKTVTKIFLFKKNSIKKLGAVSVKMIIGFL